MSNPLFCANYLTQRSVMLYPNREDYRRRERGRVRNNNFQRVDIENLKSECTDFMPKYASWHPNATEVYERVSKIEDTAKDVDVDDLYKQLDMAIRADIAALQASLEPKAAELVAGAAALFPFMKEIPTRGISRNEGWDWEEKLDTAKKEAEQTIRNTVKAREFINSLVEINESHAHIEYFNEKSEQASQVFLNQRKEVTKAFQRDDAKKASGAKSKKRRVLVGMKKKSRS